MELEWEYTRTWRTHHIDNGVFYPSKHVESHWRLWEIVSSAPYGQFQAKHGYDLYHKGKLLKHGKTVKELKIYVSEQPQE